MRQGKDTKAWKWFVAVSAVALIFFLFAFGREYVSNLQVQREIADLEEQKLSQEQAKLETMELIGELSSEYFLEQEGRVKQGLGKEGETVVVIQDNVYGIDNQGDELDDSSITNITYWFYYFFNHERFEMLVSYENS